MGEVISKGEKTIHESRKIIIKNRKLIWIFNPDLMDKLFAKSEEV